MEERMVKYFSKESNKVAIHAASGHFATTYSHINYYIDITSLKTRLSEAKEAAKVLASKIITGIYVDTIVCLDGTEMIGAFLAEEFVKSDYQTMNTHDTIYVIAPEANRNQIIFRDNNKGAINGKHVILLMATTTTGNSIFNALEAIRYYGGEVEAVCSIFSTVNQVSGYPINHIFDENDIIGYAAYPVSECPYCKRGMKIEAMVNGFGYSLL
ncbi:MAG: orotate phosphoribosyltransferase [Lachnospiraceae bacterium]|nr:orotate phosphoribosyltransferase [Lachnospiraceae bacterium]